MFNKIKVVVLISTATILLILFSSLSLAANTAWFNTTWNYRIPFNLVETNSSTRYYEPVFLNFTGLSGKINSCVNESRVTQNGSVNFPSTQTEIASQVIQSNEADGWCYLLIQHNSVASLDNASFFYYFNTSRNVNSPGYVSTLAIDNSTGASGFLNVNWTVNGSIFRQKVVTNDFLFGGHQIFLRDTNISGKAVTSPIDNDNYGFYAYSWADSGMSEVDHFKANITYSGNLSFKIQAYMPNTMNNTRNQTRITATFYDNYPLIKYDIQGIVPNGIITDPESVRLVGTPRAVNHNPAHWTFGQWNYYNGSGLIEDTNPVQSIFNNGRSNPLVENWVAIANYTEKIEVGYLDPLGTVNFTSVNLCFAPKNNCINADLLRNGTVYFGFFENADNHTSNLEVRKKYNELLNPLVTYISTSESSIVRVPKIEFPVNGTKIASFNNYLNVSNITNGSTLYWYINGTFNKTSVGNTTFSALGNRFYNLTVAEFNGFVWSSNATYVGFVYNARPSSLNVSIYPSPAISSDNLTGASNFSDPVDNNTLPSLTERNWFLNGTQRTDLTNKSVVLSGNLTFNDAWIFSVRYFDGLEWGDFVNSSAVYIGDATPPEIYENSTSNSNPTVQSSVTFFVNVTDSFSQIGSVTFQVTNPNQVSNNLSASLLAGTNLPANITRWSVDFIPTVAGVHLVKIFVSDSSNNKASTVNGVFNFTASAAPSTSGGGGGGGGGGGSTTIIDGTSDKHPELTFDVLNPFSFTIFSTPSMKTKYIKVTNIGDAPFTGDVIVSEALSQFLKIRMCSVDALTVCAETLQDINIDPGRSSALEIVITLQQGDVKNSLPGIITFVSEKKSFELGIVLNRYPLMGTIQTWIIDRNLPLVGNNEYVAGLLAVLVIFGTPFLLIYLATRIK